MNGSPEAVVVVGRSGTLASWSGGSGGGGPRLVCSYYASHVTSPTDGLQWESEPSDPEAGQLYAFSCSADGQVVRSAILVFDPGDPFAGVAAAERALEEARRRLDLPLPEPAVNPPGAQLVGVPTWLWLEGAWQERAASASVGSVTSTVTARPVEAVWEMGDGTTVTCGAGTPYDPSRPARAQTSACTHVFTDASSSSPGGVHHVSVTVSYEVGWSATTGAGGPLGGLSRTASFPVVVEEAQAVIR